MHDDAKDLKSLGSQGTTYPGQGASAAVLETFPNPARVEDDGTQAPYEVAHAFKEFSSLCPKTGQPDFASVHVTYVPRDRCVETKSLKLYYFSFRNEGCFMERIANQVKDDLADLMDPVYLEVVFDFMPRGGIATSVCVTHGSDPFSRE